MTCWLCGFETTKLATNAETPSCMNHPCPTCIATAKVDEEINETVTNLRRLLAKRCDLRSEQNCVHDLMHRLPVELRSYIFELFLLSRKEWGDVEIQPRGTNVKPLHLTSICRTWRNIALSNPSLWSTMDLVLERKVSRVSLSSWINFVHDWILRSCTLPLTIRIVVREEEGLEVALAGVLDTIGQHSNQVHYLSLELPFSVLRTFHPNNFPYDGLRRLRLRISHRWTEDINQPVPLLNPKMSPKQICIRGLAFQSLQISWNNLTSAKVDRFTLEDITQLFRHASQMTYCQISEPRRHDGNVSMLSTIHQSLKALSLCHASVVVASMLLDSLTLPCLEEFHTTDTLLLIPRCLPAVVRRSSCLLTSITIFGDLGDELETFHNMRPLPGVTDLVLETVGGDTGVIKKLLEDFLPDLRHLTLRLRPFLFLWNRGIIPLLLDRKGLESGGSVEGRLHKLLVVDQDEAHKFDDMWNSGVGKEVKGFNIRLREDGFEFL